MRHIITVLCCLVIVALTVLFGFSRPEVLIKSYSSVIEVLGKSQLTSGFSLIGERYDEEDDYTGCYRCTEDGKSGQDVVYGGCSIKSLKLRISGKINKNSGNVRIFIRNGKNIGEVEADENGSFNEEISFDSGDSYILVQYEKFSGDIDFKIEYAD